MDAKSIYLEKIKSWGESRYFDFRKSPKGIILNQKEDYYVISFITGFLLLKND